MDILKCMLKPNLKNKKLKTDPKTFHFMCFFETLFNKIYRFWIVHLFLSQLKLKLL